MRLPPYILFKGKHLYSAWTKNGPAGAFYSVSKSEWMEAPKFLRWFCKMLLAAVSYVLESDPVILFMDGHHSHISISLTH